MTPSLALFWLPSSEIVASRCGRRGLVDVARQRGKTSAKMSIAIDARSLDCAMDPTSPEVGYMSKGLTAIGSRTATFGDTRMRPLTLLERPERAAKPRADLLAAIHDRVIPELLLLHSAARGAAPPAHESTLLPSLRAVSELARIAVCEDLERALAFVDATLVKGLSPERVLIDLVAPAAVLLDTQVSADARTSLEGAIGKSLLQMLVHVLGARRTRAQAYRGLVLLVAAPSERSALGIYVLEESLGGAGWHVRVEPAMPESELVRVVESVRVETVGISVGRDDEIAPLRRLVAAVRKASRNRDLVVLLAGSMGDADTAAHVGADHCSADPRDAVRWLDGRVRAPFVSQLM